MKRLLKDRCLNEGGNSGYLINRMVLLAESTKNWVSSSSDEDYSNSLGVGCFLGMDLCAS